MLPPRWLVQVPAWPERMMVSGEVSKRLADAVHAAKKKVRGGASCIRGSHACRRVALGVPMEMS